MKRKDCFTSAACYDSRCPNIEYEMADNRWGYGIAEDMGLEKIKCKDCVYHTGECKDCTFFNTEYCCEYSIVIKKERK